jgi:hypothetical protein
MPRSTHSSSSRDPGGRDRASGHAAVGTNNEAAVAIVVLACV